MQTTELKNSMLPASAKSTIALKRSQLGPKLLLLACSLVIVLAVAESTARLVGFGDVVLFVHNDDWGFLMKPSQVVYTYGVPVRINTLGLRGPEVHEPKPRHQTCLIYW